MIERKKGILATVRQWWERLRHGTRKPRKTEQPPRPRETSEQAIERRLKR